MPYSSARPPTKPSILLVDDTPANLFALESALAQDGCPILQARSGVEALACARAHDFAAILLDVQMPVMDGFETARNLRRCERAKNTPIIFLTANYPSESEIARGYEAGAVDFLSKPLNIGVLRAKVAVFCELFLGREEIRRQAEHIAQMERNASAKVKRLGEKRYQNLVEGIRDGIVWAADLEMRRFTFVSSYAQRIAGYPLSQWLDEDDFWKTHLHSEDEARVSKAFCKIKSTREPFLLEHRLVRPDGESVWLHTAVHVEGEEPETELRGLSVDITHWKETETALRNAIQARDEFLSIASHELRTPITPLQLQLQGFLRWVKLGRLDQLTPEKIRHMIEISDAQVSRLARLIGQLLDVSRISEGRLRLEVEETDLADLIRGVVDQLGYEVQAAECKIQLELEPSIRVAIDRLRMEQVLVNLITNALKYGAEKPIDIELRRKNGFARIRVTDRGIGIAPSDQPRIFGRFERAVSSDHYGGLGLGLYISRHIVELHSGKIWVESDIAKGASFVVDLPMGSSVDFSSDGRHVPT